MYKGHVMDSGYGFALGMGGPTGPYYDVKAFESFSDKGTVCQVPFSQWKYLGIVLYIWTLTIIGELKSAMNQVVWLSRLDSGTLNGAIEPRRESDEYVVVGLPNYLKFMIVIMLVIPRTLITCVLCWLGCRWLSATLDFSEVLVNAVALEFIINLNQVLYDKLMSSRNKLEVQLIKKELPTSEFDKATFCGYLGTFSWGIAGLIWVYLYLVKIQMVLPGYNWDVQMACAEWIGERYDFWRI